MILLSGLEITSALHYQLLEWKDANMEVYMEWVQNNHTNHSINRMTEQQYTDLLAFSGIKQS